MEFGKVESLEGINWELPPDDPSNPVFETSVPPRFFAGATAWGVKNWVGKIYPEQTPADKFLYQYSRAFSCIELNSSHYRIPAKETTAKWLEQVPKDFIFCPKILKDISHSAVGLLDDVRLSAWLDFLKNLDAHCGPSFIQFHERFSYEEKYHLFKFLERWPSEFKLSIELRHRSWFQDHKLLPALADYLRRRRIGVVITDVAGRRDVLHTTLTAPWSLVRLVGNELDPSDEFRLQQWALRTKQWQSTGLEEAYLFFHQPEDVCTIEFAEKGREVFEASGFSDFPKIEKIQARDLFSF